jgi:transposase
LLCRKFGLFSETLVAIDGSKFKTVNTRDKNYTPGAIQRRIEQADAAIARYLTALDTADRQEPDVAATKIERLQERLGRLREQMRHLREMEVAVKTAPDRQISLIDPDARAMASAGKGTGMVGYNVQTAVDAEHHLIVAHAVTNSGNDRDQLASMARQARDTMGHERLTALADRGYYSGREILDCVQNGIVPYLPKPLTSGAKADGWFGRQDFIYLPKQDAYRCPAGETLKWWFNRLDETGRILRHCWTTKCPTCPIKVQCTTAKMRRLTRWEHEGVLDEMQKRLDQVPQAMRLRRRTVEHPFGTIKIPWGSSSRCSSRVGC